MVNYKLLIAIFLILFIIGLLIFNNTTTQTYNSSNRLYQGPVPDGYSEKIFRETGRTVKEIDTNG